MADPLGVACPKNDAKGLILPNFPEAALSLSLSFSLSLLPSAAIELDDDLLGGGNGKDAASLEISIVGRPVDAKEKVGRSREIVDCRLAGSRTACMRLESGGSIDSTTKVLLQHFSQHPRGRQAGFIIWIPLRKAKTVAPGLLVGLGGFKR